MLPIFVGASLLSSPASTILALAGVEQTSVFALLGLSSSGVAARDVCARCLSLAEFCGHLSALTSLAPLGSLGPFKLAESEISSSLQTGSDPKPTSPS